MSSETDIQRLTQDVEELQIRLSFQEDSLQSLNDVIAHQDATISNLQEQLRFFSNTIKVLESAAPQSPGESLNEKPPNY